MVDDKELLIREVDEELRRERLLRLWKRYGPAVIALAVGIVIAVAAWQGWSWYRERQLDHDSTLFERTARAVAELKPEEAAARWAELSGSLRTDDYRLAATMRQAAAEARAGRFAEAAGLYGEAAGRADDARLRYFARLQEAVARLEGGERDAAVALLERLAVPENPFYHGILELLAALALETGDLAGAEGHLDAILDDPAAPPGLAQRARQLKDLIAERRGARAEKAQEQAPETAPETGGEKRPSQDKAGADVPDGQGGAG
ncbi:MAG: hypothetical protein KatS3mg119_1625 [Rhodothalassiaceae bacterium]|nr:MAG: hypothetical protein KatS3mg119_1625 [Rhodothalassiaceae bacterium]